MSAHHLHTLLERLNKIFSVMVVMTIVSNSLLPAIAYASAPEPPAKRNYNEQLLAASDTLLQGPDGDLIFPHPNAVPNSARMAIPPLLRGENWLMQSSLAQASVSGNVDIAQTDLFSWHKDSSFDVPQISRITQPASLPDDAQIQSQNALTYQIFLPLVNKNSETNTEVIGEKEIFSLLLPQVTVLETALSFSTDQASQVQTVVEAEQTALADLKAEADTIINDESKTLEEKRAEIANINYNDRVKAVLKNSQTQLQAVLGSQAYSELYNWLNQEWQLLVATRNAIRSTTGQARITATQVQTNTCPVFDVFATRSTYTNYSADLPDKYVKFANLGVEYNHGYTSTIVYSITVQHNGVVADDVIVGDVVWNHNDNYWNTITDTIHPRRAFTDLPHGLPEAEAAYFDGYNGGLNEFGQLVTNPSGLNVSSQVSALLGLGGSGWVKVMFPWGSCTPTEIPTDSHLERSWGVNQWSQSVGHLANPVTGNQSTWFRDLYWPAPGLPVDIVRYYNHQDGEDGIFGRGWSSEIDMRVYPVGNGSYKVRYSDGQRGFFKPDGQGGFVGDVGSFESFALLNGSYVLSTTDQLIYSFNSAGRLQSIGDYAGNTIQLQYAGGNPTKIIDPMGREITLTFDGNGHVTSLTDPDGRTVSYSYGSTNRAPRVMAGENFSRPVARIAASELVQSASLNSVTDVNGGTTTYQYDATTKALIQATDAEGIVFLQNTYDEAGRLASQSNYNARQAARQGLRLTATQGTDNFEYDAANRRSTVTDKLGNKTIYVYDDKFRMVEEIDALGNSIKYKYDENDKMVEKTDKRGNIWQFEYDERGNMVKRIDPIDHYSAAYYDDDVTTWEYDDRNQMVKMTNALGQVTQYEYDDKGNQTKVTEANGAVSTSKFNDKGQLVEMVDALGRMSKFEYDDKGNRTKITDPLNGVMTMTYDEAGRVLSRTDQEGNTTRYEYDKNGNPVKVIDPKGNFTLSEYDKNNNLIKQTDRRGNVTTFEYDEDLNMVEMKDALGNVVKYEYDAMKNRTKVIDALGGVVTMEYDVLYRITKTTDPAGFSTSTEYDENGNVIASIDALGGKTRIVYDALNRKKYVYDAMGHQTELCYDQLDRVIRSFDPRRALTRYEYDKVGNMVRTIDPLGAVTEFGYDLVRNNTTITDPNGHTSTTIYDALGQPIKQIDALGNTWQTEYDKVGQVTASIDARGNRTEYHYDVNGNVTKVTNAAGAIITSDFDVDDNQIKSTDENGNIIQTEYDALGRVKKVIDAQNQITVYEYDANSNVIKTTDAKGNTFRTEYDKRNLPLKEFDALNQVSSTEYDALGRPVKVVDANGQATTYHYDILSRLTKVVDAKGQSYQFEYNAVGNNTRIIDPNDIATSFEYNMLGQMVKETNPLSRTWEYHFDPAGNMVMKVDGSWQALHYDYDAANRLIRTLYPDGKTIDFEYDANGNRTKLTDWNGVFTDEYDVLNRVTRSTDYKGRSIEYDYDSASNLTSLVYPDGKAVNYAYDERHQMTEATLPGGSVTQYSYDDLGLLTQQTLPSGAKTAYNYDANSRLTSLSNRQASDDIIAQFAFVLDPIGNRTQTTETRTGQTPVVYDYSYDEIYQLTSVESSRGQAVDYAYDPNGNRMEQSGQPDPIAELVPTDLLSNTYEYDNLNAMLRAGESYFDYDPNGNRIEAIRPISETEYASSGLTGTIRTEYLFDAENRLVTVRDTVSQVLVLGTAQIFTQSVLMEADYSYDGQGRRIAKLVQTYTLDGDLIKALLREYVYNGLDVVAEYEYINGATQPDVTQYYYGNGPKLSMHRTLNTGSEVQYWYLYDALGSVVAMLNNAGAMVAQYHHDEYGRLLIGDYVLNHYLFTGQEYDEETGLLHFFARYYDSDTGVWLSQDIQRGDSMAPMTWHRYMYVSNNPINSIDPLGYWGWSDVKKGWDSATKTVSKAVNTVKEKVVKPAMETVKNAGQYVKEKVVEPVVNRAKEVVQAVDKHIVQPVKRKTEQVVNHVNEQYIQPTIDKGKELYQSARETVNRANEWYQKNKELINTGLDVFQGVLDVAGMIPVVGEVFDLANAAIYVARGDYAMAALSVAAMVPFVGMAATGAKFAVKGAKYAMKATKFASKALSKGDGVARLLLKGSDEAASMIGATCKINSFNEDTLVSSAEGDVPINELEVGDQVLGYHELLAETSLYTVTDVISHTDYIATNLVIDGEFIQTTPNHPFYTLQRGWVFAGELWLGANIQKADGSYGRVSLVTEEAIAQPMYNLTVASAHTYFVGEEQWLVHNCSTKLNKALGGTTGDNLQAHHLIPEEFRSNSLVKRAMNAGWDMDGAKNGILLPDNLALSQKMGLPKHFGPHPTYSKMVGRQLDKLSTQSGNLTNAQLIGQMNNLSQGLSGYLQKMGGGVKLR